ncbi:hypothetical protein L2E82_39372 [Cichorium intybus]|uniref:Uncharacterized protein n=1 Tax=Cichorium intybus TaxID=13427 RepID=A0ACB9AIM4_CICIN|nr:hypothetical protein L2E82_39372 [Cichorium intybus]
MEKLPEALVFEILNRLDDSADVARCQVAWKTFNTVSPDLRSINLQWPLQSHIDSRSRVLKPSNISQYTSPFKTVFLNLVSNLRVVESVRVGANYLSVVEYQADDLYLTDDDFVKKWLPGVSGALKSLSISNLLFQTRWGRSNVLSLVSMYGHNLVELEVKNARLSVKDMNPMPMLTSLTLESIRLEDNSLTKLNKCFPNLQVLNFKDIRGLKLPIIHHLNLKTCHWTISGAAPPLTLITPNLITLRFKCLKLASIHIEAPLLSDLHLSVDQLLGALSIKTCTNLKTLWLECSYICSLIVNFPHIETMENLTLSSQDLHSAEVAFNRVAWDGRKGLKTFRGYFRQLSNFSLMACMLDRCINLVDVSLLFHRDVAARLSRDFLGSYMVKWPKVKWRFGIWEEGTEDSWITDGYLMHK